MFETEEMKHDGRVAISLAFRFGAMEMFFPRGLLKDASLLEGSFLLLES